MPTLTIKDFPDDLHRRLKRQADAHRRSLSGEIIACLQLALGVGSLDAEAWLAEAQALRTRLALKPLTRGALAAARLSGRP